MHPRRNDDGRLQDLVHPEPAGTDLQNPGRCEAGNRIGNSPPARPQAKRRRRPELLVEIEGRQLRVRGRQAWALDLLIHADRHGVTTLSHPGPRWGSYIHKLRQTGISIETRNEPHDGIFAEVHARYVLASPVRVLERRKPG